MSGKKHILSRKILPKVITRKIFLFTAFTGLGGGIYLSRRDLFQYLNRPDLTKSSQTDPYADPQYIYISSEIQNPVERLHVDPINYGILPWWRVGSSYEKYVHWKLLKIARSKNKHDKDLAIARLSESTYFNDAECRSIAQACDFSTCLHLAQMQNCNLKLFLPPPKIPDEINQGDSVMLLRKLLDYLPVEKNDTCLQFFTNIALGRDYSDKELVFRRMTDDGVVMPLPKRTRKSTNIRLCLEALYSHSLEAKHRGIMVERGILQLLQKIVKENPEQRNLIGKIISNLSLDIKVHKHIFVSGWIGILAGWFQSSDLELELLAGKTLSNLDSSRKSTIYANDVYLLYPLNRKKEPTLEMDVILVHGLLGGAFRTWRQHDSCKPKKEMKTEGPFENAAKEIISSIQEKLGLGYSQCWPKDWLSRDLPNARILAVDYDSRLSDWTSKCPYSSQEETLEARSTNLLESLLDSGLGQRPIIWVTHSMGGLLVKQMLLQSWNSMLPNHRRVVERTVGTVFYSVPHKGSFLANLKPSFGYLSMLSADVLEIKNEAGLLEMHENFLSLVKEKNISCLSFGEMQKTNVGMNWNFHVVSPDSADLGIGEFHVLETDHLNSCKPIGPSSDSYKYLLRFLENCNSKNKLFK